MDCSRMQRMIWEDGPSGAVSSHLEGCPSCRAEARRAEQLRFALSSVRGDLATPPADLEPALLALVPQPRLRKARELVEHPRFWQGAAAVGAAAAATVGVLVARRRVRPQLVA